MVGSMTSAVSMDIAWISGLLGSNLGSSGGRSMTVGGAGLGASLYSSRGRGGGTGAQATEWVSDTFVMCKVATGAWGSLAVAMTSGERVGSMSGAASYDRGMLSSVLGVNRGGTGGGSMSVSGADFGASRYSAGVRVGMTGAQATEWMSDTGLAGKVAMGMEGSLRLLVSSGVEVGSVSGAGSYDGGGLSGIGASNQGTTGGSSVSVWGVGFGTSRYSAGGRVGRTGSQATVWVSESFVVCKVGSGGRGAWFCR